jgi:hypothetical protein
MATSSLASFQLEEILCVPNIQLLIHLFIIRPPSKGQFLALFTPNLTHQYSVVVSVLKLWYVRPWSSRYLRMLLMIEAVDSVL